MTNLTNATSTKKHLSATVYYFLTGLVLGWPGLLATGYLLPRWKDGTTVSALSLATIHLLILGSMLTVAFGVLYQIVPIAFQAAPLPRHILYWHLPLHVLSILIMVVGFLFLRFDVVGIGGTVLICSTAAYFTLLVRSYARARNKTPVHKGLIFPFISLWLVFFVGVFQAFYPGHVTPALILTHALLGAFAFWGGLVLIFSYKLVPMFAISHGYKASLPRSATLYYIGVCLWIAAAWSSTQMVATLVTDLGGTLIVLGLVSYAIDIVAIVRARKRRRLVVPLYDAFFATSLFIVGLTGVVLTVLWDRLGTPSQHWLYPSIYVFTFGGLMALMFSYMQKMVPFLWFEYRFSRRPERKTAPLIDDMVPQRTAQSGMALYFLGTLIGTVQFLIAGGPLLSSLLDWVSASCLTMGSILLFLALRHVLTIGGKRPDDDVAPITEK